MKESMEILELKIAICDDISEMNHIMSEMIHKIMETKDIVYKILKFNSGIELLEQVADIHIVFLDIEMPEMDGIETGVQIGRLNPECKIVIASAREDRMKECFKVNAFRFVSKPYNEAEVQEALETYLNEFKLGLLSIEVFKDRKSYWIRQRDIQYIKAFNGTVNIYTCNSVFRKEITLNKIEEILDMRIFYKTHKAYMVGLYHVTDYTENKVLLYETSIPLSRRSRTDFERTYIDFDVKYRG